ncbi:hypothetical protein [Thiothrix fructosivorans]|uniref:Uncharacterized protein n=1 Tax=Thiothrix fructosivorans TaxID=111770 RepID=A0A8B0SH07_9GAMM|nr:hypothetical protein [Thiothrix fructosivorans]MBO0611694.1 hypothetical protein [Thiothrix fructosivorans]QTX10646.1 hypothetical protein J1836_019110 [Thiothrix fructosivorans]
MNLQRALSLYEAGGKVSVRGLPARINAAFNLPTASTHGAWQEREIGDVSPYVTEDFCRDSLIPALIAIGLIEASSTSRKMWVDALTARKAVGGDVANIAAESVPVATPSPPVPAGRPQLAVVR